ncbi:MAG: beta-ketoacyl-[acyl-carrier-protein] synthase family protein [Legionella sp.]|nr:beta-ketoacyl-[acyl-carrier-protein] synthase family protein [Legionella sp.]
MKKRVVITGMEITSSIGTGLEKFWQAAQQGQSGIKKIQGYDPTPYPTQIGGEITDFSLDNLPQFNKTRRYSRAAQYAFYCAHNAIKQANIDSTLLQNAGTYIGSGMGGYSEIESIYQTMLNDSWKKIPALSIIRVMPNSIANHIAIEFGLSGPNSTISNACISSAEAIGTAYQQIVQGRITTALCGGTESLLWEAVMATWCKLKVMSTRNEEPHKACRPFDLERDGMVIADGAGVLILEELSQARARGAKIYAEIIGYGTSCDAFHVTAPSSEGQQRAIHYALDDARVSANDVHYINAHGTGTPLNDSVETQTIKAILGSRAYDVPVTAQKSMTGHAIGAAGAMEIIATALCLQQDRLLPTINLETTDPECDLDYVPNKARSQSIGIALSNHFAFGGANAALVLRKYID